MLVLEAWGNRASSFWTTNRTSTFLDRAEPSSRASKTSFSASSCIAYEEELEGEVGIEGITEEEGSGERIRDAVEEKYHESKVEYSKQNIFHSLK